jgi:hypothetical protein
MIVEEAATGPVRVNCSVTLSPVLLRLRMLELEAGLRTLMLPIDIAAEVRVSIGRLRSRILRAPANSDADRLAKTRTASEEARAGRQQSLLSR